MQIAVIGAGGVGGYYGGLLARAGHRVTLLARGEHLTAIRQRGLEIRLPNEQFVAEVSAVESANEIVGTELALVAVKSYSLEQVAPAVRLFPNVGRSYCLCSTASKPCSAWSRPPFQRRRFSVD